jgi:hypothetical protein
VVSLLKVKVKVRNSEAGNRCCISEHPSSWRNIVKRLGLAKTIHKGVYLYNIISRENILHTVIYGVHIRFWPTLK